MAGSEPDRSLVLGGLHIDLWRGLFRDEVRVWIDVRPAAGGLLSSKKIKHGQGDALFDETVRRHTV